MENQNQRTRRFNSTLTRQVIDLHSKGYTDDFLTRGQKIICIQSSEYFSLGELNICLVNQGFDQLSKTYKYVHTIETEYGTKGLLVTDAICSGNYLIN